MARLKERTEPTKDGFIVTLTSPVFGEGEALIKTVREIFAHSEHLHAR